jgi:hypothetical protein
VCVTPTTRRRILIIVEGPDGAGKSTLVEEICNHFDLQERQHEGNKSRDDMYKLTRARTYTGLAAAVENDTGQPLIYDRFYFSEIVYGPLQRDGKVQFSTQEQYMIEAILKALSCPIIFCLPDLDAVIENIRASEQMKGVLGIAENLYERYSGIYWSMHYRDLQPTVMRYDYQAPHNKPEIMTMIDDYCQKKESIRWH